MKGVTIDKLDIKDHLRWAQDQEVLESAFVTEASLVAHHPEILGMSIIYPSKFEELFELQKKNQHWASFTPPPNFQLFRKRFFSYRLFPTIHWEDAEEKEGEDNDTQEDNTPELDLVRLIAQVTSQGARPSALFEKDKDTMLSLLESIKWLSKLLRQINARKLQYQKG